MRRFFLPSFVKEGWRESDGVVCFTRCTLPQFIDLKLFSEYLALSPRLPRMRVESPLLTLAEDLSNQRAIRMLSVSGRRVRSKERPAVARTYSGWRYNP